MRKPPHMFPYLVLPMRRPIGGPQSNHGRTIEIPAELDCFVNGSQSGNGNESTTKIDRFGENGTSPFGAAPVGWICAAPDIKDGHTLMRFTISQRNTR
jgi:hypothetical protein